MDNEKRPQFRDSDRRGDSDWERRGQSGRQRGQARLRSDGARSAQAPSERRRETDAPRNAAFDVLRQVAASDAYANLVLPGLLRERRITGRDAAFATELTYGTLRLQGRYDAVLQHCVDRPLEQLDKPLLDVLRLGAHQILGMRVPSHAAVSETVGMARQRLGVGASQFANAVLRKVSDQSLEEWLDTLTVEAPDKLTAEATCQSHPVWIARALRDSLVADGRPATDLDALMNADNESPRVTLIARPGLISPEELALQARRAKLDVTKGQWVPEAFTLLGGDPLALSAIRDGRAGVQDEGSQLVALALAAAPLEGADKRWLDLCAGPGGKAALLGALAAERGAELTANEVQPHRANLVRKSVQAVPSEALEHLRVGDGREVGDEQPHAFDRVLVDAPCTGLGALRRRPESRWRRTPADLATLAKLQRELLQSAIKATRKGGVVAYVTCSPHLAETRHVIDDIHKAAPEGALEVIDARPIVKQIVPEINLGDSPQLQLWPHIHGTDAMHLTLLRVTA